jgi:hypothetical protein
MCFRALALALGIPLLAGEPWTPAQKIMESSSQVALVADWLQTSSFHRNYNAEAYPYGERKYWPYKVWLSEIKRQLAPTPASTTEPGPDGPLMELMEEA